jgi:dTDP-4-dehydrorhamnose reductase
MSAAQTILLLGKNGQVGWELQRSLAALGNVVSLDRQSNDFCGDLSNPSGIVDTVRRLRPAVIVNAAAYTAVDKAEADTENAYAINADAVAALAQVAHENNALLIHYSTDYVFNGGGSTPWKETDATGPLNIYGKSKLAGEQAIVASGCNHLIFRTSWVYAARGNNFIKTMLRLAQERDQLSVVDDQSGAPTGADLIADVSAHCIRIVQQQLALGGIYHLAAAGNVTWHGYASAVIEHARNTGVDMLTSPQNILPVASDYFKTAATRPLNSRLDTTKLKTAFSLHLPEWQFGVNRMLTEYIEKK